MRWSDFSNSRVIVLFLSINATYKHHLINNANNSNIMDIIAPKSIIRLWRTNASLFQSPPWCCHWRLYRSRLSRIWGVYGSDLAFWGGLGQDELLPCLWLGRSCRVQSRSRRWCRWIADRFLHAIRSSWGNEAAFLWGPALSRSLECLDPRQSHRACWSHQWWRGECCCGWSPTPQKSTWSARATGTRSILLYTDTERQLSPSRSWCTIPDWEETTLLLQENTSWGRSSSRILP